MKKKFFNNILRFFILAIFTALIIRLSWPNVLRTYIETGIGSCEKIPIFCMAPQEEIVIAEVNKDYLAGLVPYQFPKVELLAPKGFNVIQEMIKKIYYKRSKRVHTGAVIYVLTEPKDYFMNLFPEVKKQGIKGNYNFMKLLMAAKVGQINNLTDAFFVIMKGVFTPDLGNQNTAKMVEFTMADRRGFINYNFGKEINYFDCSVINNEGVFFKLYVKDAGAKLGLVEVFTIISTLESKE